MQWIEPANAEAFLRDRGWIHPADRVTVETLTGGVSNQVLYIHVVAGPSEDFVLKQARPQLRTPEDWHCDVERIWREVDVLRTIERHAATARVPRILFEDRPAHAFAMSAARRDHAVWKANLLAGQFDPAIAHTCGQILAAIHHGTWQQPDVAAQLADQRYFDALRLDPYYRHVARQHPPAASLFAHLIADLAAHPRCLVHADFSPKNLLVSGQDVMLVDFETGHYGDPAFDLGFFLSHMVLKTIFHDENGKHVLLLVEQFWTSYRAAMLPAIGADEYNALLTRSLAHLAGCVWARVDGKSKTEYLTRPHHINRARTFAQSLLAARCNTWAEALSLLIVHSHNQT